MAQQDGFDFRGIRLDGIDEDWLSGLIGLRENDYLDVKLEMYGGGDSAKRELAADVTSIANAAGGLMGLPRVLVTDLVRRRVPLVGS